MEAASRRHSLDRSLPRLGRRRTSIVERVIFSSATSARHPRLLVSLKAELPGVVAGGAGLASLAIQLADGVVKLRGLYKASKNAPQSVGETMFELDIASQLVRHIERRQQSNQTDADILIQCVVACCLKIQRICDLLYRFERQMPRFRGLGKMYSAFREPEVKKLLDDPDRARGLLLLAYADYCQSQSRRESAVSAASALVRESVLHQRLTDLRTDIKSGNDIIAQQISTPMQSGATATAGSTVACTPCAPRNAQVERQSVTKAQARKSLTRRTQRWQVHLRLSHWFSNRMWDIFAACETNGALSFQMRSVNIRPPPTPTFECLLEGNVAGVRALLETGALSLWHHRGEHQKLLSLAAMGHSVELCRMLLESAPHLRERDSLVEALCNFIRWRPHDNRTCAEPIYRLLVDECQLDVDLTDGGWMAWIFDRSWSFPELCREILLRAQLEPLEYLSFESRFAVMMETTRCPPAAFLVHLKCGSVSWGEIVSQRDDRGKTALHWAMDCWRRRLPSTLNLPGYTRLVDAADLVFELLKMGADPVALDHAGHTPPFHLMHSEWDWLDATVLEDAVQEWGEAMRKLAWSLTEYVAAENAVYQPMWTKFSSMVRSQHHSIDGFAIAGNPSRLTFKHRSTKSLFVRRLVSAPGSFPQSSYVPDQICWYPGRLEEEEAFCAEGREVQLYYLAGSACARSDDDIWADIALQLRGDRSILRVAWEEQCQRDESDRMIGERIAD